MQISVTGHHVDITDSLKDYVDNKFAKLERHFEHIINIHVILTVEKDRQKAEATVNINRGDLFADNEQDNMYAAIDGLIEKLDRQLLKHKEKLTNHHRAEGRHRDSAVE